VVDPLAPDRCPGRRRPGPGRGFVTIATLGYGDITPRLPLVQMLAVLEAVGGQFYVAVVIAWLVSASAAHRRLGA
jgi:hypothetical protein